MPFECQFRADAKKEKKHARARARQKKTRPSVCPNINNKRAECPNIDRHVFYIGMRLGCIGVCVRARARCRLDFPRPCACACAYFFHFFFWRPIWRCEGVEYAPSPLVPLSRACVFSYTVRASVVLVFCFCFVLFLKSLSCALGVRSPVVVRPSSSVISSRAFGRFGGVETARCRARRRRRCAVLVARHG